MKTLKQFLKENETSEPKYSLKKVNMNGNFPLTGKQKEFYDVYHNKNKIGHIYNDESTEVVSKDPRASYGLKKSSVNWHFNINKGHHNVTNHRLNANGDYNPIVKAKNKKQALEWLKEYHKDTL